MQLVNIHKGTAWLGIQPQYIQTQYIQTQHTHTNKTCFSICAAWLGIQTQYTQTQYIHTNTTWYYTQRCSLAWGTNTIHTNTTHTQKENLLLYTKVQLGLGCKTNTHKHNTYKHNTYTQTQLVIIPRYRVVIKNTHKELVIKHTNKELIVKNTNKRACH